MVSREFSMTMQEGFGLAIDNELGALALAVVWVWGLSCRHCVLSSNCSKQFENSCLQKYTRLTD